VIASFDCEKERSPLFHTPWGILKK